MTTLPAERFLYYISEILQTLKSTNQYEQVLHLIVDRLVRIYKCQTCAVVLIDTKTEYLNIENSFGLSWTFCKEFRRKVATGSIGELLWTGKTVFISDCERQPQITEQVRMENPPGSCLAVQIAVDHRTLGYLYADSRERDAFAEQDIRVLQAFADFAGIAILKSRLHEENMRLDRVDHETGLEKYGAFIEKLGTSLERAKSLHENFAVEIIDVDNFKSIVKTYGYDASKQFLKELGDRVKGQLGHIDAGGRYGYDEIIILLANRNVEQAVACARNLARAVEETPFTPRQIHSTISIGVAAYPQNGKTVEGLLLAAKNACFEAQRAGRNNVFRCLTEWNMNEAVLHEHGQEEEI